MFLLCVFLLLLLLPSLASSQALPNLPDLPSPSPNPTPSPLPSALNDILNPSPTVTTAVPPDTSESPGPSTSTPPDASPLPSQVSQPSPTVSPTPNFVNEQGVCQRDVTVPRPKLGKSQRRYAIAVLVSAAAVGIASVLYNGVYKWKKRSDHSSWRFLAIVIARVLIFGAVRVSAALVASITKASPGDSALDASGAFLTWGTAIFTRLYHEGIVMTLGALGLAENEGAWDDKLEHYFNENRFVTTKLRSDRAQAAPDVDTTVGQLDIERGGDADTEEDVSILQHVFGGKWERQVLLATAVVYFIQEIAVLVSNVLDLVGSFEMRDEGTVFFGLEDSEGQCPFSAADIRILIGGIALLSLYALTYQPSLAPILRVSGFHNIRICFGLRWMACLVLLVWVGSLLTLPLLERVLEPFFIAGDISLFWYVFIGPPSYSSISYIITATYTCLAALVGAVLLYRISTSQERRNE